MNFLKDLLSGHEAFFAASDAEKGWGGNTEASTNDVNEEEQRSD